MKTSISTACLFIAFLLSLVSLEAKKPENYKFTKATVSPEICAVGETASISVTLNQILAHKEKDPVPGQTVVLTVTWPKPEGKRDYEAVTDSSGTATFEVLMVDAVKNAKTNKIHFLIHNKIHLNGLNRIEGSIKIRK